MKAISTVEIDVTDFMEDENLTIHEAEIKIKQIIEDAISNVLAYPDSTLVSIV